MEDGNVVRNGDVQGLQALATGAWKLPGNGRLIADPPGRGIVSARRGRSRRRRPLVSVAQVTGPRHGPTIWAIILLFVLAGVLASANTAQGSDILTAVQRFTLF